jgi:hypothetical protein
MAHGGAAVFSGIGVGKIELVGEFIGATGNKFANFSISFEFSNLRGEIKTLKSILCRLLPC